MSAAYVGSQGRNLFLRSITNQIVGVQSNGASAATVVREFAIVSCANGTSGTGILCPGSSISGMQNPYGEVDYKTSGGTDSYNALQLALNRRSSHGLALNGYTLATSKGTSGGTNEARTAGNAASFASERPANRTAQHRLGHLREMRLQPLRRAPHVQLQRALQHAWHPALKGGWSLGGIFQRT
jgi:hypothetical protein